MDVATSWPGRGYALNLILFVAATKLTTAANAIFLQSTAPVYLLFIGPLVLRNRFDRATLLMAAMGLGMSLFFVSTEPAMATAPNPALGNVAGRDLRPCLGDCRRRTPVDGQAR